MTSPNTLAAAITNSVLYQLMNIHTCFPGKILSYDYTSKKANIQPQIDKKYTDGTVQAMPVLTNVPVIMPQAGSFSITYPVNEGDFCLVLCCERSIDNWLQNGQQAPPNDPRKLDLSDAVAIMGLMPFNSTSPATNNNDVVISYSGSSITITSTGAIKIQTSSTVAIGTPLVEVLSILSQLLVALQGPAVTGAVLGGPLNPAFVVQALALQTLIDSITGTIP